MSNQKSNGNVFITAPTIRFFVEVPRFYERVFTDRLRAILNIHHFGLYAGMKNENNVVISVEVKKEKLEEFSRIVRGLSRENDLEFANESFVAI